MRSLASGGAVVLALLGAPAYGADMSPASCPSRMPTQATATTSLTAADHAAPLAVGRATTLALAPIATVHFPARPEKTNGPYGGLFFVDVVRAGAIRISLGARVWIDVAEGTTPIASVAHAHGQPCSGVAKAVTFPLTAGRHAIEITASDAPTVALAIAAGK